MTTQEIKRKTSGLCVRCGAPASETSVLCEPHRLSALERFARWAQKWRPWRRKRKQCAGCGAPSVTYRCETCAEKTKTRHGTVPEGAA